MTALDVGVVIATYGTSDWEQLARDRAVPSVKKLGVPWVHIHGESLHQARNEGLSHMGWEWLVFLDADDELEPGYFDAMATGSADLRAPAVRYVGGFVQRPPHIPKVAGHSHECRPDCLRFGNWLVVGSMVRREIAINVGGWRDFPWSEDWDLWLRCWQAGATVEAIPEAIYRAHVRKDSRNRGQPPDARLEAHRAIARANGVPVP